MSERIQRILLCDGPHDQEALASHTLRFTLQGRGYVKDVCTEHLKDAEGAMGELTTGARRDTGGATSTPADTAARRPSGQTYATDGMSKRERDAIRDWARAVGVADIGRGRIPGSVVDAYKAAHP